MADKTSLIIDSVTTNGVAKQKTIPYVNPDASNADALAFAHGLIGLTTRTYSGTVRVDRKELDSAPPTPAEATITLNPETVTSSAFNGGEYFNIGVTTNSDATPYAMTGTPQLYAAGFYNNEITTYRRMVLGAGTKITIRTNETANYKSAEAIFSIV